MGIIDRLKDAVGDKTGKVPGGFRPEVCQGCPKQQTEDLGNPCGLCGCPTVRGGMLDGLQMTPGGCLREDEHKEDRP